MLAKFEVGAEIDIASGDELRQTKDSILKGTREARPLFYSKAQAATSDGTNAVKISLGSPPVGTMWKLDHIVTFGSDDHTSVPGVTGAVYVGGSTGSPVLGDLVLPGLSFPDVYDFPDSLYVHNHGTVYLITASAPTAGQQIGCIIRYREYVESEITRYSGAVK